MSWVTYGYFKYFGDEGVVSRPMIEVEVSVGNHHLLPILAIIDSGCTTSMINASFAQDLGLDIKSGVHLPVGGIGNGHSEGYIHMVKLKIKDMDYEFDAPLNFVTDLPADILLGQNNFFEHFNILFEKNLDIFKLQAVKDENEVI